jgi:hypothetical protein
MYVVKCHKSITNYHRVFQSINGWVKCTEDTLIKHDCYCSSFPAYVR